MASAQPADAPAPAPAAAPAAAPVAAAPAAASPAAAPAAAAQAPAAPVIGGAPAIGVIGPAPPRTGRNKGDRTRALNKDLALLVHIGELTLPKIKDVANISKSSISHHLKVYQEANQRPTFELLRDEVLQRVKAKLPALFPPSPAAPRPALPDVEVKWDDISLSTSASNVKREAQIAAGAYYNKHKATVPGMSWTLACAKVKAAFDKRKFKHPLTALNPAHTAHGHKHKTLARDTPRAGSQPALHVEFEKWMAWNICNMRNNKAPMCKAIVCHLVQCSLDKLEADGVPSPLPGGPTTKWYKGFCERYNLETFNEVPLDVMRDRWCIATNFFKSYLAFGERMVLAKIMTKNANFVSYEATPKESPFFWIESEKWRVMESDEIGLDLGIKSDEKPKTQQEKMVGPSGGNKEVRREGVPDHHISGMFTISFDGQTMLSGMCMDAGEGACLAEHVLKDDDGTLFTVPLPDGHGQLEEVEVFWWSNEKGSWDKKAVIAYMKATIERHQRVNNKVPGEARCLVRGRVPGPPVRRSAHGAHGHARVGAAEAAIRLAQDEHHGRAGYVSARIMQACKSDFP